MELHEVTTKEFARKGFMLVRGLRNLTRFSKVAVKGYHIRNEKLSGDRTWSLEYGQAVPGGI